MRLKADDNNNDPASSKSPSNQTESPPIIIAPFATDDDATRDSDGEDGMRSMPTLIERDRVREYLEKNPSDRTEKDIQFLLDFMQHMPAFSNMTMSMKRSLCRVMVFAVVEKAGTVVLRDGEKLDSWSVILNGHLEVARPDGTIQHLHMGDSFGVSITRDTVLQEGVMMTKSDDCQFVCIPQEDFYDILHKEKENIIKINDSSGEVVMVMEKREFEERGSFVQGKVVLRGTPDMLMKQLMDDNMMDDSYISDFLLTYRTFMKSHVELVEYLSSSLKTADIDKAVRIMHAWILNHFLDFESNIEMFSKLEKFFEALKDKNMQSQLNQLQQACTDKAHVRQILFVLKNDEEPLQFILAGGQEKMAKIFVSHVDEKSPASKAGLRVADQIISVNNHNLDGITLEKAYEFLQMTNHLMLTVKSNLLDFEKLRMKTSTSSSPRDPISPNKKQPASWSRVHLLPRDPDVSNSSMDYSPLRAPRRADQSPQASRLKQALGKMNLMQKSETCENYTGFRNSICSASAVLDSSSSWNNISWNQSVDLQPGHRSAIFNSNSSKYPPEELSAIAIFRADQTCKHILVKKSTTVREAIEAALVEFEVASPSNHYSLCQITLDEEGTIKTKHLPNHVSDLSERCTLNSRYYLRDTRLMEKLISGDLTSTLSSDVNFLQLPFGEVASQLTQRDMQLFCSIDPVEYVNDLFEIAPVPQLTRFSELVNEEMFWVVTEVCSEPNCLKRSKILKQFIKIAERCHKLKNFNSMFAILSGLGHGSVSRLRQTWEKLSDKYHKLFEEMQGIMDPSRNMLKYRNLLLSSQPPLIPFFPLVKKDLTFIHFGNDSRIDGLINFDKLRMISKEIRLIYKMASAATQDKLYPAKASMESLISSGSSTSLVTPSKKFVPSFSVSSASLTTPAIVGVMNARKIYEEGQTSRTVKTYIANLKIISDENKLSTMSIACESNGKSRKVVSSSSSNVCRNVLSREIAGPRFGSENPASISKLMSLSEDLRPVSGAPKTGSPDPTNGKKASRDKNRSKPPPQTLHLSLESSSVSNDVSGKKDSVTSSPLKIVQLKRNEQSSSLSPSISSLSLSSSSSSSPPSSSSSSLSNENKMVTSAKATESAEQTSGPSSSSSSSSSSSTTSSSSSTTSSSSSSSQSDNVSSSTSSGICSIESASSSSPSLHHRNHHHHHHRDKYYDIVIIADDDLDNLPSGEIDDDDDEDECDVNDLSVMGSSRHDNAPFMKDGESNVTTHSDPSIISNKNQTRSSTCHVMSASDLKMPINRTNVAINSAPKFNHNSHQRKAYHNNNGLYQKTKTRLTSSSSSSPTPSSSSPSPLQRIPPSYEELLNLKQAVPSQGSLQNFNRVDPQVQGSSPGTASRLVRSQAHSKCCCCSICFQSSYNHRRLKQATAFYPKNCRGGGGGGGGGGNSNDCYGGSINGCYGNMMEATRTSSQHRNIPHIVIQQSCNFSKDSQNFYKDERHFVAPYLPTNQILQSRSCDLLRGRSVSPRSGVTAYKPYATVLEDDDDELVTLV